MKARIKGKLSLFGSRRPQREEPTCETCSDEGKVLEPRRFSGERYGEMVEVPCPDCK